MLLGRKAVLRVKLKVNILDVLEQMNVNEVNFFNTICIDSVCIYIYINI